MTISAHFVVDSRLFGRSDFAAPTDVRLSFINPSVPSALGELGSIVADSELVFVSGDDRLVGHLAEACMRHAGSESKPPLIAPVKLSIGSAIRQNIQLPEAESRIDELIQRYCSGTSQTRKLPLMKVVSSAEPVAHYGFSMGLGAGYELFHRMYREGGDRFKVGWSFLKDFSTELFSKSSAPPKKLRWRDDGGNKFESEFKYCLVTSMAKTWFGWSAAKQGDGIQIFGGLQRDNLINQPLQSRFLPISFGTVSHGFSRQSRRICIDCRHEFALDGRLFASRKPRVIDIRQSRKIGFVEFP